MKQLNLRASSNKSWLEATQQLIAAAQQKSKNLRSLSIQEDKKSEAGKYRLIANLG